MTLLSGSPISVQSVKTPALLAGMSATLGTIYLNLGYRSGYFDWVAGNQSALVAADPLQGVVIPPAGDTTGAQDITVTYR
jgi:hypothetical protein